MDGYTNDPNVLFVTASYLLPFSISLFSLFDIRQRLPSSKYSIGLQFAFVFDMVASIFGGLLYSPFGLSQKNFVYYFGFPYSICISLSHMSFFLSQIEFLGTITPLDERIAGRILCVGRVVVVTTTVLSCICVFSSIPPATYYVYGNAIVFASLSMGFICDTFLNGYIVVTALRQYKNASFMKQFSLVATWLTSVTIFYGSISIIAISDPFDVYWVGIPMAIQMTYFAITYLNIVIIRSMLSMRRSTTGKADGKPPRMRQLKFPSQSKSPTQSKDPHQQNGKQHSSETAPHKSVFLKAPLNTMDIGNDSFV